MLDDLGKDVIECANKLQSHMMKGMSSVESWKILREIYSERIVDMAMDLLKEAVTNPKSPYKGLSDTINRCMSQLDDDTPEELQTIEGFYRVCERAYKIFENDKDGRALPIVFMYNKNSETLGVSPITGVEGSPMDKLKQIVYTANPDAYCMCAEASMSSMSYKGKNKKETEIKKKEAKEKMSHYKYGDIIDDPNSRDCLIMQGNDKTGTKQFTKIFMISGKSGKLKFKEKKGDYAKDMECNKLP